MEQIERRHSFDARSIHSSARGHPEDTADPFRICEKWSKIKINGFLSASIWAVNFSFKNPFICSNQKT